MSALQSKKKTNARRSANVLNVMVMKKETFVLHAESDLAREAIMKDLIDCIDFAAAGKSTLSRDQS